MVPNVYGMGLYADGGRVGSKPYLASANYINKMSDYCQNCPFDHKKRIGKGACPFNFMYWSFLIKHEHKLRQNYRMARTLYHLKNMDQDENQRITTQAQAFLSNLG
jgi:deoxyribodipyrimidine photolyase-related protein